jgi:acetyl esterase/lipase
LDSSRLGFIELLRPFDNFRVYPVRRIIFVLAAALLLTGCSPADPLNLLAWRHGIEITRSVAYGEVPRQTLDVYRPASSTKSPVVVFFYGGSWQTGDKETYFFVATALARRGYVVVVPDYGVYPHVRYPGFLQDGARAVRWAKDNAARFGGDPGRLFIMGHSAGAYIAAMLVLDSRWLQEAGLVPNRDVAGLIGISGPYDFLPLHGTLATIFGGSDVPDTQPISHVAPGAPPALLVTGKRDRIVEPSNTTRLAAKLTANGDKVEIKTYPWVGHITIIGSFAWPLRFLSPVLDDVDRFIAAQ